MNFGKFSSTSLVLNLFRMNLLFYVLITSFYFTYVITEANQVDENKKRNLDLKDLNSLSLISSVRTSESERGSSVVEKEDKKDTTRDNQNNNELHENAINKLKYVWGDALDDPSALGPDGKPYPWDLASQLVSKQRNPRSFMFGDDNTEPKLISPQETRKILLSAFETGEPNSALNYDRQGRSNKKATEPQGCVPSRLCMSSYNTTAPLYGVSLTSGKPVTIVQKFPDLLQQVVFQVCRSSECSVIHGTCTQSYTPYLFLVLPLGPVTLTGQDYVLVESGCVCQPKYAKKFDDPPPLPFIQVFSNNSTRGG